jgi:polyhydroxyalkanoate synthesis regulator phasin
VIKVRDLIEKGFLVGLRALTLTREKAQSIVDGLVKKGEARRDEARGLVDRLVTRGEEERAELQKLVRAKVENIVEGMSLATQKDIEALSKKIDGLARKLEGK